MKEMLLFGAVIAVCGLVGSMVLMGFLVDAIPSTSPTQGNLVGQSVSSTVNLLLIPSIAIVGLAFLAFLCWLFKMRG